MTFQITGDPDTAQDRVGAGAGRDGRGAAAHPGSSIGEFGDASANKAINERIADDFQQAEVTSLPVTLVILVARLRRARRGRHPAAARPHGGGRERSG